MRPALDLRRMADLLSCHYMVMATGPIWGNEDGKNEWTMDDGAARASKIDKKRGQRVMHEERRRREGKTAITCRAVLNPKRMDDRRELPMRCLLVAARSYVGEGRMK